jgi:hypothetical protein
MIKERLIPKTIHKNGSNKSPYVLGAQNLILFESKIQTAGKNRDIGRGFVGDHTLIEIAHHIQNVGLIKSTTNTLCVLMNNDRFNSLNFILKNIDFKIAGQNSRGGIERHIEKLFMNSYKTRIRLKNKLKSIISINEKSKDKEYISTKLDEEKDNKNNKAAIQRLKIDYFEEMWGSLYKILIGIGYHFIYKPIDEHTNQTCCTIS